MGRWSRAVAAGFVTWLNLPSGLRWLDIGCGTGALTATILAEAEPANVVGTDPSEEFVDTADHQVGDPRAQFVVGDAIAPISGGADVIVSGLVINSLRIRTKRSRPGGPLRHKASSRPMYGTTPKACRCCGGTGLDSRRSRRSPPIPVVPARPTRRPLAQSRARGRDERTSHDRYQFHRFRRLLGAVPRRPGTRSWLCGIPDRACPRGVARGSSCRTSGRGRRDDALDRSSLGGTRPGRGSPVLGMRSPTPVLDGSRLARGG
jgi:SAM-dependent methyltransferase